MSCGRRRLAGASASRSGWGVRSRPAICWRWWSEGAASGNNPSAAVGPNRASTFLVGFGDRERYNSADLQTLLFERTAMSEQVLVSQDGTVLNSVQRVVDTFVAPEKTFSDVKKGANWWLPFLIAAVFGLIYAFTIVHKIGLPALVDGVIHQSSALEDRLANATPEQAAAIRSSIETQFKVLYIAPVFSLILGLVAAGILLATAN